MTGKNAQSPAGMPQAGPAETSLEIIEGARGLRQKADFHGLRMLSYLLDLVELEAHDSFRAARNRETGG